VLIVFLLFVFTVSPGPSCALTIERSLTYASEITGLAWGEGGGTLAVSYDSDRVIDVWRGFSTSPMRLYKEADGSGVLAAINSGSAFVTSSVRATHDAPEIAMSRCTSIVRNVSGPNDCTHEAFKRCNFLQRAAVVDDLLAITVDQRPRRETLAVYDTSTWTIGMQVRGTAPTRQMTWHPSERVIATIDLRGTVRIFHYPDGVEVRQFDVYKSGGAIAYSQDGANLLVGRGPSSVSPSEQVSSSGNEENIRIIEAKSGKMAAAFTAPGLNAGVTWLAALPDRVRFVATVNNALMLGPLAGTGPLQTVHRFPRTIVALAVDTAHAGGRIAVAGGRELVIFRFD
jgi:hypothetical protein